MKFICQRADLIKSINIALRAVSPRTTMPILSCILVQAFDNGIFFQTNDMELCMETKLAGTVIEQGVIAIDAKLFSEIARKLPEEEVILSTNERNQILIVSGTARLNIPGQDGDEFPVMPEVRREDGILISQYTLKNVINQTIFCTLPQDNNLMLTGELLEVRGDQFRLVALDGHRIAIRRTLLHDETNPKSVIVPGKALSELSKILTGEVGDLVTIFITTNHIVFQLEDTLMISTLISGKYFAVDKMVSSDHETMVVVNRQKLIGCIDRAALFVRENDKKPIIFDITDNVMNLSIDSPIGAFSEDLSIAKEGRDLLIGFNPKLIIEALKAVEEEEVTLYFINAKSPCSIRDLEETYTYLVLPVNFTR